MCSGNDVPSPELGVGQAQPLREPSPIWHQDAVVMSDEEIHLALRPLEGGGLSLREQVADDRDVLGAHDGGDGGEPYCLDGDSLTLAVDHL